MARTKRGVTLDEVVALAERLSPAEQARLIERVAPEVARALGADRPTAAATTAWEETLGGWADLDVDAMIAQIYRWREEGSRPADRP
jgi:hypothetical protein